MPWQLEELMLTIRSTAAHYIRCMKPNPVNEPGWIHRQTVVDQLRYGGVLEAVRVARVGCVAHCMRGMPRPSALLNSWRARASACLLRAHGPDVCHAFVAALSRVGPVPPANPHVARALRPCRHGGRDAGTP
jgi:hypothetical protein